MPTPVQFYSLNSSLSLMERQVNNAGIASDMSGIRAALKPEPFGDASDGNDAPKT